MKKLMLLICMLMLVCMQFGSVLFYDEFNRAEGGLVGNDWVNIGPVNPIIEDGAMKIVSSNLQGVKRDFTALGITSGIYYVSWDWKINSNDWLADAFPNGTITYLRHDYEGNLYYDNTSDFSYPMDIGDILLDTWVHVKLKVSIDTDSFSLWIDDLLVVNDLAGVPVEDFTRFTFRAGSGASVIQYVDNFLVYNETPPSAPSNLTASGTISSVMLNWTSEFQNFLTHRIYRSLTSPANELLTEISGIQTNYLDNTLSPNTTYYYRVQSVSLGHYVSNFSNEISSHLQPSIQALVTPNPFELGFGYKDSLEVTIVNTGNFDLNWHFEGFDQHCYGSGIDGDLIVGIGQQVSPNIYTNLNGEALSGTLAINVVNSSGFNIGDEILIITSRDYNITSCGTYEFCHILSKSNNTIYLEIPLKYNYTQNTDSKHQVIRIPNYNNVLNNGIITCSPWNGNNGGVLCFRALGSIANNGFIDVSQKGYYGGTAVQYQNGNSGEGLQGFSGFSGQSSLGAGIGGLGHYVAYGTGGSGAGHYSVGGGSTFPGGSSYGSDEMNNVFFGSGGGAGGSVYEVGVAGGGGKGAGILLLYGNNIQNNGSILSNGEVGGNGGGWSQGGHHGGGGGGSGGTIYIETNHMVNNNHISALGGGGGLNSDSYLSGGQGSNGRIRINGVLDNTGSIATPYFSLPIIQIKPYITTGTYNGTVSANSTVSFWIYFDATITQIGSYVDTLQIVCNDPTQSLYLLSFTSMVLPPIMSMSPDEFNIKINAENIVRSEAFQMINSGAGKALYELSSPHPNLAFLTPTSSIEAYSISDNAVIVDGSEMQLGCYNTSVVLSSNAIPPEDIVVCSVLIEVDIEPPLAVADLAVDPLTTDSNQIGLTWSMNAVADSVTSYKVYRRGRDETSWRIVGSVPNTQNCFIDNQFTGLDSTYVFYRVRAVDWVGNMSPEGYELMATLERFLAPDNVQIDSISNRDIHLTWNPVTHTISGLPGTPTCYVVYKSQYPSPVTDFDFLGVSFIEEYTHQWALYFQPLNRLFYIVTAYGGNMSRINELISQKSQWKYGELEAILNNMESEIAK